MARDRTRKIDNVRWIGWGAGVAALSAGQDAQVVLTATAIPDIIMRTRGQLFAYIDAAQAPASLIEVAVGFILVPQGTTTAVLWSPITDPNAPWFWYTRFALGYEEYVIDVIDAPGASVYRETIDSKAMRKAPPDTEVQMVVEQATLNGAASVNLHTSGRFLIGN